MRRAIAAFGRNDLRTVGRDSLLISLLLGPFMYAALMWLVPAITAYAARQWNFDLVPYHSAIVSAFCVMGPPILLGAVLALQLLDERDQRTMTVLRVTPVPHAVYPAYRAIVTGVLAAVMVVASLAVSRMLSGEELAMSVPVAVVAGLMAPIVGFLMASVGRNKVEGLAVMRVIGLALFTIPFIPFFFLDEPWQFAFGLLPPYWPLRAFWSAMDGGAYWPYLAVGSGYNALLCLMLLKILSRRLA
ncbi:ABC transporter permease [Planobispora siamensis]|uniref:Fluoroquinolones export permease protein n=1 Tax=Planobispora siamensis TaxID=936338 RepID=A0A8J3SRG8_9ACTN|nr:ABC transporter permease [Planobispora siamensis]GIH97542.1 fluoroquinolones export permease protein [Planobispora siamensis]